MRQKLTPAWVRDVTPKVTNEIYWDTEQRGFGLLVLPSGERRYVVQYRAFGRSRRLTFKPGLTLTEARKEAKAVLGAVAKGGDPMAERRRQEGAATNTLKAITEEYFGREGKKLRSAGERHATFERLIFPVFGARQIDTIKRSEIVRLLDKIEDERGPSMAHVALAHLSRVFNWHASRDDDFLSPIRRGMGRIKPADSARSRVLTDDELRAVWRAAESTPGPFGHYAKFLLLTATRRTEAARMRREELSNGDWVIPAERMKGRKGHKRDHLVPLSAAATAILDRIPTVGPFVFTTDGKTPIAGFPDFKRPFDKLVLADLRKVAEGRGDEALLAYVFKVEELMSKIDAAEGDTRQELAAELKAIWWRLHDLRRTARSLMSRAGVNADHAERCLAHIIGGVRGVYDRHAYRDEKVHAFKELAALIERIVNPPAGNVVPLRSGTEGAA
jgi:integrase